MKKKDIELREKEHKLATDENLNEFEKELLEVEILEIKVNMNNIQNSITGAVRKMSFFTTQYKSILEKLGKDDITEEEYEKEESRKKIRALLQSFYGYTDDNNPFGDPDLSKPFVWNKKIEKMRARGLEPYLDIQSLILKLRGVKKDLDKIRKSKLEREENKEKGTDQKMQNKEVDEQIFDEWKNKDEKFHLAQEKLRTEIRIKQGREKPVDFIHKVLMIWKGFFKIPVDYFEIPEYQKPYLLYDLLDAENIKELYNELNIQLAIDRERLANKKFVCFYIDIASNFKQSHDLSEDDLKEFIEYWSAMIIILESYIFPEKNIKNLEVEMREAIDETLKGRTFNELDEIEKELEKSDDFLSDETIRVIGYQVFFQDLKLGMFLFNHSCNTTIAIDTDLLLDLYDGPFFFDRKPDGRECPGRCLNVNILSPCSRECRCAFISEIMQVVKNWGINR